MIAIVAIMIAMLASAGQATAYALPFNTPYAQSETQPEDYKTEYVRLSFASVQQCAPGALSGNSPGAVLSLPMQHTVPGTTLSILPPRGDILYLHMLKLF